MGDATDQICDAARMGDENLVRKLLDDGTNVHGSDDPDHDRSFSGKTPLWITCRNAKGGDMMQRYLGVVRLLIERGARVNDGGRGAERGGVLGPPLYQVCYGFEMEHNMVEIAAALIDGGADVNAGAKWTVTLREAEYGEETPLWAAAKSEHLGLVRLLLARGAATEPIVGGLTPRNSMWPLGAGFHSGLSGMAPLPLYYACGAGLVEVVRALLDAGADPAFVVGRVQCPRTGDVFDVTPLWNACGWAPQNGATTTHVTAWNNAGYRCYRAPPVCKLSADPNAQTWTPPLSLYGAGYCTGASKLYHSGPWVLLAPGRCWHVESVRPICSGAAARARRQRSLSRLRRRLQGCSAHSP